MTTAPALEAGPGAAAGVTGFQTISDLVRARAREAPRHTALRAGAERISYGALDAGLDRVATRLQQVGLGPGDVVGICGANSIAFVTVFLGASRMGAVLAPLPVTAAPADLAGMLRDSEARILFADKAGLDALAESALAASVTVVALEPVALAAWTAPAKAAPSPTTVRPEAAFNIIYSSGTTGAPKGIVQPHAMRWAHVQRAQRLGHDRSTVTLVATQPYSNLTLVSLLPTLACGGTAVLFQSFDAGGFLEAAERLEATHTMLVPVQYRRLLDHPSFAARRLDRFKLKVVAGAPCSPELKRELLERWPGELVDLYGMTEGGVTCLLFARERPDKLHTVGRPQEGHDLRIIAEDGSEAGPGELGEVVGRSASMMSSYHNQPERTRDAEWRDAAGQRFIRTGDIGRLDEDGFLLLVDRKKDMIISGGFNLYPSDLEAALRTHPAVAEAAVVGAPSRRWGETPIAFVTLQEGAAAAPDEVLSWANQRLGRIQRIAALEILDALPRSAIDKVLKSALRGPALDLLRRTLGPDA